MKSFAIPAILLGSLAVFGMSAPASAASGTGLDTATTTRPAQPLTQLAQRPDRESHARPDRESHARPDRESHAKAMMHKKHMKHKMRHKKHMMKKKMEHM